ncbi:HAD family hydrolase [Agrobacterium pusense]|uniref:HAD family hydrolase n=1 Tax=Agrobacterium pusense TaxID=648995 RepID=UPI000ED8F59C|nr:hypothetical protein [Agrobacterium sp.]
MTPTTKTRVLLLSNLDVEIGDPYFRSGAYKNYLLPIARALSDTRKFDTRFALNQHIFSSLFKEGMKSDSCFVFDPKSRDHIKFGRLMTSSYTSITQPDMDWAAAYAQTMVSGWQPDLILCWEAPTGILRKAFPSAVVIDLMPSMFARPPFPKSISIDPVGLYKDAWFSVPNPALEQVAERDIKMVEDLRDLYLNHFNGLGCESHFRGLLAIPKDKPTSLTPLQISKYFGFSQNCEFSDQYEFLESVIRSSSDEAIIATQYVGGLVSEVAINDSNIRYLQDHVGDVRYSKQFEKVDSVSQYIVPWVDKVYSVSSTLGLQAKFFGKKLVSPSRSHLKYLADSTELNSECENRNQDPLIAAYLTRGVILFDRIVSERGYFAAVIDDILSRHAQGLSGSGLLPSQGVVDNSFSKFASQSNFKRSETNLQKIFPSASTEFSSTTMPPSVAKGIATASVRVVSFDIFDTLVRRTVYKPEDVFELMQRQLPGTNLLPEYAISRFAEMRQGAERLARQKRDAALSTKGNQLPEEITIDEVYQEFARCVRVEDVNIAALIKLEQEIELSVLRPRRIGRAMFDHALTNNKRIILTSDFIHPIEFIDRVLLQCGYEGYEKLYLSSQVGSKKHSGELFDHVLTEIGVPADAILHIGDNPIGDVKMARDRKFRAVMVPSGRALLKKALEERGANENVLNKSFYLRTIAGLFANTFLHSDAPRSRDIETKAIPKKFQLISTHEELGFAVLGPIALGFTQWIIDEAIKNQCTQLVFFARDCYLPYLMAKSIIRYRGLDEDISLVYAPTSRKIVSGFDFFAPEDVFKVRIDDFTAAGSLEKLFTERFLLESEFIDEDLMTKWGIDNLSLQKRSVTQAAIYGLAYDVAHRHWQSLRHVFDDRRQAFASYLETNTPVNFSAKTAAVDFGYQGSIHRKIAGLFSSPIHPLFFMTYSDGFGEEPIPGARAFYAENRNSATRSNICITHNLLLETLMNEGKGSAVGIARLDGGRLHLITDDAVTTDHARAISAVHKGAMLLCEEWLKECGALHAYTTPERDATSFFFSITATKPTLIEVALLSNLVFDNAFAGIENSRLVHKPAFWPEAAKIIADRNKKKPQAILPKTSTRTTVLKPIVRPFVRAIGNRPDDVTKFNADPRGYFAKLKNPRYRLVGKVLFGG